VASCFRPSCHLRSPSLVETSLYANQPAAMTLAWSLQYLNMATQAEHLGITSTVNSDFIQFRLTKPVSWPALPNLLSPAAAALPTAIEPLPRTTRMHALTIDTRT
jgi:hypothetical protein